MSKKIIIIIAIVMLGCSMLTLRQIFFADSCLLLLSDDESQVYESYIKDYNDALLADSNPLLICKLYLNAVKLHDSETCYALFNKDKEYNYLLPDKNTFLAEYMFFEGDIDFSFENCKKLTVDFDEDNIHATVSWSCFVLNKTTNKKQEVQYSFRLIKNKLNIWKVAYRPLDIK